MITETEPVPLPATGREIGVDMGVARFLTASDGQVVGNPRFLAVSAEVIADLECRKSRARPGSGKPGGYLPNQAAAKAGLNKAILDAAWHQFTCILLGKAEEAARRVVLVNPAGPSVTCHRCGARCARPRQDTVICPACGPHDADLNGAINIAARAGLGSGQAAPAA